MNTKKRWSLFDLLVIALAVVTGLSLYFSFVQPLQFSHLIKREAIHRYGEVEILLPEDLLWLKEKIPAGEESRNVYDRLDWKILEMEQVSLGGREWLKVKVKLLIEEESSGLLRYGKYTLVPGGKIFLINDRFFIEGRIMDYHLLEEKDLL